MGYVGFLYTDGVEEVIGLEDQHILVSVIADGQGKRVGVDLLVDEHRVSAVARTRGNGKRVGQRPHRSTEDIVGVDGVVERALDGGAAACKEHEFGSDDSRQS